MWIKQINIKILLLKIIYKYKNAYVQIYIERMDPRLNHSDNCRLDYDL